MAIDAVITWVDGADEAHQKKRLQCFDPTARWLDQDAALSTRFTSRGEINFCLNSLFKFAPWIRTIFIVTDGQIPPNLAYFQKKSDTSRVKIVDHQVIFRDYLDYLPTFNSLSIESMLWRIEGLSEAFIYLNDDCFLLRPVQPHAFFRAGKPVLRGTWKTQTPSKWRTKYRRLFGKETTVFGHRCFQENSAQVAGFQKKFLHLPHVPFPLLKQTFTELFEAHPDILLNNAQYAFRNTKQFWPISLVYHLGLSQKKVVLDNQLYGMSFNPVHHSLAKLNAKLKKVKQDSNCAFACVQSLDQGTVEVQKQLIQWLEQL